jgi:hypothetical protein
MEPRCAVLHVTPLLRELIVETVCIGQLRMGDRYECGLRDMLVQQLQKASPVPTFVTCHETREHLQWLKAIVGSGRIEADGGSMFRGRCERQDDRESIS